MTSGKRFAAADLDWEEPPRQGRNPAEFNQLVETVKAMVPALRERPGAWAVVEAYFNKPNRASTVATNLRKRFGKLDTIEARLEFRGSRIDGGGSKLYVRLVRT